MLDQVAQVNCFSFFSGILPRSSGCNRILETAGAFSFEVWKEHTFTLEFSVYYVYEFIAGCLFGVVF